MSYLKRKDQALPRLKSQISSHLGQSSLTKMTRELSEYSKYQQNQKQHKSLNMIKKQPGPKRLTEANIPTQMLNDYRDQLKKLKKAVEAKKIKQQSKIQDNLKRIEKLATNQIYQSIQTPRSLKYINVNPPQVQQPIYSMYQSPPPIYVPNSYMIPPDPYQRYYDDQQQPYRRKSRRKKNDRVRTEFGYDRERNYDQYDDGPETTRYQRLKQSNIRIVKRNNHPNKFFSKNNIRKLIRKWKAVVWQVFFCYLLPRYSLRIMKIRSDIFKRFQKKKFNTEMTMMQKYLVKKCKPFFMYIANQKHTELMIEQGQTKKMEQQKAIAVKKLINMIIQGLQSIEFDDLNEPATRPAELMHIFCKHGAFPFNVYFTEQQLDLVTISERNKYIRMDKNLQKSQIINFICNKILLYNTILQPQKVDGQIFSPTSQIINKNFYFLGSIWYQICLQVQDQYLSQVPPSYQLANWRKLREKMQIKAGKSLSANGKHQEQQLISGLLGKKRIEQIFGINFWRKEKNALKIVIEHLHNIIVQFHKQIKSKIKF